VNHKILHSISTSSTMHHMLYTPHPTSCALHSISYIPHSKPCILHQIFRSFYPQSLDPNSENQHLKNPVADSTGSRRRCTNVCGFLRLLPECTSWPYQAATGTGSGRRINWSLTCAKTFQRQKLPLKIRSRRGVRHTDVLQTVARPRANLTPARAGPSRK